MLVSTSGVIDVGRFGAEVAEPDRADVPNLERVVRLPDASHWVHHDEPERVSALLIDFFKR